MESAISSIATAVLQPCGSAVTVAGVITAQRLLGELGFLRLQDASSEIQVMTMGAVCESVRRMPCPCHALVCGTLQARPQVDTRKSSANGSLEIQAAAVLAYDLPRSGLSRSADNRRAFIAHLQSAGFMELRTLAIASDPSYADLLPRENADSLYHLAAFLGPCRWFFMDDRSIRFGLVPGFADELKEIVSAQGSRATLGPVVEKMLAQVSWRAVPQSAGPPLPPMALGVFDVGTSQPLPADGRAAYWRYRYGIGQINDSLVTAGIQGRHLEDAGIATMEDGLARNQALLNTLLDVGSGPSRSILALDFPEFDMRREHIERLMELFPSLRRHLGHSSFEKQFETLWSLLGHENVKAVFTSDRAVANLERGIEAGLFVDYGTLRHIDAQALDSIRILTEDFTDAGSIRQLRQLLNTAPGTTSTSVHLSLQARAKGLDWRRCLEFAPGDASSQLGFFATALDVAPVREIVRWQKALTSNLKCLFTNAPMDETRCISELQRSIQRLPAMAQAFELLGRDALMFDLVHATFGHGLLSYPEAESIFAVTSDCSEHWKRAGIEPGGSRWIAAEGAFRLTNVLMYPSKNRPAVLTKSCSGICSARDTSLFHREDHFQLTMVDEGRLVAAGSVQLYPTRDENRRHVWVVRGINPSEPLLAALDPTVLTLEVLDALASMARHNVVDALLFAEDGGLFNADSGRLPIRDVLRRLASRSEWVKLQQPLHIFSYHQRPLFIERGWRVWP